MKTVHSILNIISTVFFGGVLLVVFLTIMTNNQFFGKNQSFVVKSGSMEPTIMTGDIILISSQEFYNKHDVVTFKDAGGRIVTHRIIDEDVSKDNTTFITKGDANRSIDNDTITQENILGKVNLVIPKIGFLVGFTQTLPGLLTMIIIPVVLLFLDQLVKMSLKQKQTSRLHV